MANETSSILRGPGGTGYATVLGTQAPSLFDVMDSLQADRDAEEAVRREEEKAKTAELNEWLEYNPEKIWEPYGNHQQKMYDEYVDEAARIYGQGGIVSSQDKAKLAKMKGDIKNVTNRMNSLNDARKKSLDILKDPKSTIDKEKFSRHIGRYHIDIDNGLIPPEEMGSEGLMEPLSDYKFYDQNKVTANILSGIKEEVEADIDTSPFGYRVEETRTYKKGFRYLTDSNNEFILDKNGEKQFEITPTLVNEYMANSEGAMMVQKIKDQHEALGETVTNEQAVKELVAPYAYMKEKKQAENDSIEIKSNTESYKGDTEKDAANIWFQNLDTLLFSPQEDETGEMKYYVDADGNINTNANGDVLKPVTSQLKGIVIGKTTERGKTVNNTITDVMHNYVSGVTYYKSSDSDELKVLNYDNVPKLLQQITQHNPRFKGYIAHGQNSKYLQTTPTGEGRFVRKVSESDATKNNKKQQVEQSNKIKAGISRFKESVTSAMEARGSAGRSFIPGMDQDSVAQINNTLSSVPTGIDLTIGDNTYNDPDIEIKGNWLESSYTFWVNGEDTKLIADEAGFEELMNGMKPTRAINIKQGSVNKETSGSSKSSGGTKENTATENEDPLGIL